MKKSKFTESQIVFALKQAETGVAIAEVCRLGSVKPPSTLEEEVRRTGHGGVTKNLERATGLEPATLSLGS